MGSPNAPRKEKRRLSAGILSPTSWLSGIFSKMKLFHKRNGDTSARVGRSNLASTPSASLPSVNSQGHPKRKPPPARAAMAMVHATLDNVLPLPQRRRLRTWPTSEIESLALGPIVANHGIAPFAAEVAKRSPLFRRKQLKY